MNNLVSIKSTINATVVINSSTINLNRTWVKKGAVQRIPLEELEEVIYEPGIEYLFKSGILYIDDMEQKIALGLEEEGTEKPTNIIALSDEECLKLLNGTSKKEFEETVNKLSMEQAKDLARVAIANRYTVFDRCEVITRKAGYDVYTAVSKAIQEDAEDAAEARKAKENKNK